MRKLLIVVMTLALLGSVANDAFSWEGHYRYREGRYYRSAGWWGLGGFVTGLAVGAYVASLPPRYETVVIAGTPYYYCDGYYYQAGPSGYVVVAPPVVQGQTQSSGTTENYGPVVYIVGTLLAVFLLAGIILVLKKIFA